MKWLSWLWIGILTLLFSPLASPAGAPSPSPVTVIDLLIVYTPAARDGAGSSQAIQSQIQAAVMEVNLVFQNSRVNARVRLVRAAEVAYEESGSLSTDLARLRDPQDGFLNEVQILRDQYAADLVCLVTETGNDWWFYGLQGPSAANAFSVIRRAYITGGYYLPVALSFNFGCQLERPYADSIGAFPYAYGYSFSDTNGSYFSTVEGFGWNRVAFFSNPDLQFNGVACGVPAGMPNSANNARVLNQTAPIVASFRGAATSTMPPQIRIVTPSSNDVLRVGADLVVAAEASDSDGLVTRVDFTLDGLPLGTLTHMPWSIVCTNASAGLHYLDALATDDQGVQTPADWVQVQVRPQHDDFSDAMVLNGDHILASNSVAGATMELGEPSEAAFAGGGSVWFVWTASTSGRAELRLTSCFNRTLMVCQGTTVSNLTVIADSGVDANFWGTTLTFEAQNGSVYYVAVMGPEQAWGDFTLGLTLHTPPANDNFADRIPLAGETFAVTNSNALATSEPDEPAFFWPDNKSVWWTWTAPAAGHVRMRLERDSSCSSCMGWLMVFTGTELASLVAVTRSWDSDGWLSFDTSAEQSYVIGLFGDVGWNVVRLSLYPDSANDGFTNRMVVAGTQFTLEAANYRAGREPDEPNPGTDAPGRTLWYSWTAPATGHVILTLSGVEYAAIGVYTGESLATLTSVAQGGYGIEFDVAGGTTYQFVVDGRIQEWWSDQLVFSLLLSTVRLEQPQPDAQFTLPEDIPLVATTTELDGLVQQVEFFASSFSDGSCAMRVGEAANPPFTFVWTNPFPGQLYLWAAVTNSAGVARRSALVPVFVHLVNDNFSASTVVTGLTFTISGVHAGATAEPGEPEHGGGLPQHSLWWSWTAPGDGLAQLSAEAGDCEHHAVVTAYTGSDLTNLVLVAQANGACSWYGPPSPTTFAVRDGTTYHLALDAIIYGGIYWPSRADLILTPFPPNDSFSNRTRIDGALVNLTNSNLISTKEANEPDHGQSHWGNSIWWSWTAPRSGYVTLRSATGHWFGIYTGTEMTNLVEVAGGIAPGFEALAGTTYAIAAAGPWGEVALALSLSNFRLGTPTNGAKFATGAEILVGWTADAEDGPFTRVDLFDNDSPLMVLSNVPGEFLWTNAAPGEHTLTAQGVDEAGNVVTAPPVSFAVRPANDDFAEAIALIGGNLLVTGSSLGATHESDEPYDWRFQDAQTVWWRWIAPADGLANVVTTGGDGFPGPFVYFWAYEGNAFSNLTLLSTIDTHWGWIGNNGAFYAYAGETYYIAVAGYGWTGEVGFSLSLSAPPAPSNDHFTQSAVLVGHAGYLRGYNTNATLDAGETLLASNATGRSVWWSWTAPSAGIATLLPMGTDFQSVVAVFTGNSPSNLTALARGPGSDPVQFLTQPGETYVIAVDGVDGAFGNVSLNLELPLPNDNWANGILLQGAHLAVASSMEMHLATSEPGEPSIGWGNTVWWTWTPPTNGTVTLISDWLVMGVYTGDTIGNLTEVVPPTGEQTNIFRVLGGTPYRIAASSREPGADCPAVCGFRLDFEPTLIVITQPADGTVLFTNEITLTSLVEPSFGSVQSVDYFVSGQGFVGSATNAPFALTLTGAFDASYGFYARATSTDGRITLSDLISVSLRYPRPPNDDFAGRSVLTGTNILVTAFSGGAGTEPGEPLHAGTSPDRSLWWSYTAPARGAVAVSLQTDAFDTAIQIYTGTALTNLNPIIGNWSNGGVNFNVVPGQEYVICMNVIGGIQPLAFRVDFLAPPLNDDFVNRIAIVGTNVTVRGTTAGASKEPGERADSIRSVWWSWTAPVTGPVILDSGGSGGIIMMAVYTGSTVSNLTLFADRSPSYAKTLIRFNAQAGVTYQIAADTYYQGFDVVLNLRAIPPPANDYFANRIEITGWSLSVTGNNYFATREAGEPSEAGYSGSSSVWWKWTPAVSGSLRLWLSGGSFVIAPQVSVYSGDSLTNLVHPFRTISGNDSWYSVTAGTSYAIRLDGYAGEYADFVWELRGPRPPTPPPNDNFANRTAITGAPVTVAGTTVDATLEPGEPNTLGGSVWWSWTAPVPGQVHIFTSGSAHITPFAVFTGNSVTTLTEVTRAPFPSPDQVWFPVLAGRTYEIAATSYLWTEPFLLNIEVAEQPMYNDWFADRKFLTGRSGVASGSNLYATIEPSERTLAGGTGRTLWWSWTAPKGGQVTIDFAGSEFTDATPGNAYGGGPLVAVYTGPALGSLQLVGSNTIPVTFQIPGHTGPPLIIGWRVATQLVFQATSGTTYHFAVDGANGSMGQVVLRWSLAVSPPPPPNDDFANRLSLGGTTVDFTTSLINATKEPGEPDHAGQPGGWSGWWTWTAPESGPMTIAELSGMASVILAVYTGDSVSNLSVVGAVVGPRLSFAATTGTTYQIAVDGNGESAADLRLSFRLGLSPTNDDFNTKRVLTESSAFLEGNNVLASHEADEFLAGGGDGKTLWWTWTAPTNGTVVVTRGTPVMAQPRIAESIIIIGYPPRPPGPPLPPIPPMPPSVGGQPAGPLVAVYSGNEATNLILVASNNFFYTGDWFTPPEWRVLDQFLFPVTAGTVYQISVDSCNGSAGDFALEFDFLPSPPNDAFSNSVALSGTNISVQAYNFQASKELGEPDHAGDPGGASVWWTWTAPCRGRVTLDVTAAFTPLTAVYVGNSIAALAPVSAGGATVSFLVAPGTTYRIAVDGEGGAQGRFDWSLSLVPGPGNDQFANALTIQGTSVAVEGTLVDASFELGEPKSSPNSVTGSVWYRWTAPYNGEVRLRAGGNCLFPVAVYLGSALNNLLQVASDDNSIFFYARAGATYHIAIADILGIEDAFVLTLDGPPTPPRFDATALAPVSDGTLCLRVNGVTGQSFAIQASTNLVDWETLVIDTVLGDSAAIAGLDMTNFQRRFYRVLPLEALFVPPPPTVRLVSPVDGTVMREGENVVMEAEASDEEAGITEVVFLAGDRLLGGVSRAPFRITWANPAPGLHSLTALALNTLGIVSTSSPVQIQVKARPWLAFNSPTNTETLTAGNDLPVDLLLVDSDGTVTRLDYYLFQGTNYLLLPRAPGETLVLSNAAPGLYCLGAVARDEVGALAVTTVSFLVNEPPTVRLFTPSNGTCLLGPGPLLITGEAVDPDGKLRQVEFFDGTNRFGEIPLALSQEDEAALDPALIAQACRQMMSIPDLNPGGVPDVVPFSFAWSNATAGTHSLSARATDYRRASVSSPVVIVTVLEQLPVSSGPLTLTNLQPGNALFVQTVCITNPTPQSFDAVRLWIHLEANSSACGVMVGNATGMSNGVPFLLYDHSLLPGQGLSLNVEYLVPELCSIPNPSFRAEGVPISIGTNSSGLTLTVDGIRLLANGLVQVGFRGESNRVHYIQYSEDLTFWRTTLPAILGTGQTATWEDAGPPRTPYAPQGLSNRFYRLLLLP